MSSLPTTDFDLPDEDLTLTIKRKSGQSFTINLTDLQLLADTNYDPKLEYIQVLQKIKNSLQSLFSIQLSLAQVEWLYLKKKEIELELKKNGLNESEESNTTDSSQPSTPEIPLDQWVEETSNTSSS